VCLRNMSINTLHKGDDDDDDDDDNNNNNNNNNSSLSFLKDGGLRAESFAGIVHKEVPNSER